MARHRLHFLYISHFARYISRYKVADGCVIVAPSRLEVMCYQAGCSARLTSGYSSECCLSMASRQSAHSPLNSDINDCHSPASFHLLRQFSGNPSGGCVQKNASRSAAEIFRSARLTPTTVFTMSKKSHFKMNFPRRAVASESLSKSSLPHRLFDWPISQML